MQDQEWTIEKVSQEPAREWNNPKGGVVYYKKVKLAGHDKPVSVGKKDPSVLQVGSKLSGHIEVNVSDAEDKFKPAPLGFVAGGGQQSFGGKPAYKDNSDGMRQGMCFNNAANWVATIYKDAENVPGAEAWAKRVYEHANALYKLGDLGGSEDTSPKAKTTSNPALVNTKDPSAKFWPSENDDEANSLYATAATAEELGEPIDLDSIPF
jgi:hypothetical protein